MSESASALLLDPERVEEIRRVERAAGRHDLFSSFVRTLESNLAGFSAAFAASVSRGDHTGAERAAHTLKGACRQLGALALGDLFAEIERSAHAGNYDEAKQKFDGNAALVAESLEALKRA